VWRWSRLTCVRTCKLCLLDVSRPCQRDVVCTLSGLHYQLIVIFKPCPHLLASLCANVKVERLKIKAKQNHFALKSKLYLAAVKSALAALVNLKEQFAIT
jgi:hypothetical protein